MTYEADRPFEAKPMRGEGVQGAPYRLVREYWSREGKLLAENDPAQGEQAP